jgi:hypothetical protein
MNLSNSIQIFYKNVIESPSDDVWDDDSKLMMATTMLLHELKSRLFTKARSRMCGQCQAQL